MADLARRHLATFDPTERGIAGVFTEVSIMLDGPAKASSENKDVRELYLGMSSEGRTSFCDRKSYRRRKQWD